MRDALVIVDAINDFGHAVGDRLLASFEGAQPALRRALDAARRRGLLVVYVNDHDGTWDGDVPAQVRRAVGGPGGDLIAAIAPQPGEAFLLKGCYSAFDHTPLDLVLAESEIERVLLAGAATEMCVVQTAIAARELGLKVTILADACAHVDEHLARIALEYADAVGGALIGEASELERD